MSFFSASYPTAYHVCPLTSSTPSSSRYCGYVGSTLASTPNDRSPPYTYDTPVENPDKNPEPQAPEPDKGTTTPDSPCGPTPDTGVDNSDISLQSASASSHSEPKATITSESLSGVTVSEFHSSAVNSSSESHSSGSNNNSSGGGESHSSHEERKKEED